MINLPEQTYILLSSLVYGYHKWAEKQPEPDEDNGPNDDPASYFVTDEATVVLEGLLKTSSLKLPFLTELQEKCDIRSTELFNLPPETTPLSYFGMAMMGEGGEFCNLLAKLERKKLGGASGSNSVVADDITQYMLEEEIGGLVIYLAILAQRLNISIEGSVINTFNEKSVKMGYPVMLGENEGFSKKCVLCGCISDPSIHSGCERANEIGCNWFIRKNYKESELTDRVHVLSATSNDGKNWVNAKQQPQCTDDPTTCKVKFCCKNGIAQYF